LQDLEDQLLARFPRVKLGLCWASGVGRLRALLNFGHPPRKAHGRADQRKNDDVERDDEPAVDPEVQCGFSFFRRVIVLRREIRPLRGHAAEMEQ
jgi:hypothetical protein